MALLNYSKTYQEVLTELGVTFLQDLPESSTGNYVKLFFTGDGNIITHGKNYLPLFTESFVGKGLVPVNTSTENKDKDFLRGDGSWAKITTSDLPIWKSGNYSSDTILDSSTVKQLVDKVTTATVDAMHFKGVVSTTNDLPTGWKVGDIYRIGYPGNYFGHPGEIGDMLICITTGSTSDENYALHWTVVQTNLNGEITINVNNTAVKVYSNSQQNIDNSPYNIYAPTTGGLAGVSSVLIGSGTATGTPIWARLSGLSITGTGTSSTLSLNTASSSYLGGIKIDTNHGSGNTPTVSIDNGTLYLSAANIANALGFMPAHPGDIENIWRDIKIGGQSIGDASLNFIPTDDVYVKVDNNIDDGSYDISFGLSWWNISANNGQGAYETA